MRGIKTMTGTRTKILDLAESLTQRKGFNGFSYSDIAGAIGVKTASIHDHFKRKNDLAAELQSVSPRVAALVQVYFRDYLTWFKRQFEQSSKDNPTRLAFAFLNGLEGFLLFAQLSGDPDMTFDSLQDFVLS